ncbi:MAG: class I SAM-dependent methyltransferase [Patescibacteria group bacterium]|jgi:SAM-dependent methyltransferase
MKHQLLYKDLARYYDHIYSFKNYEAETKELRSLIEKYKRSKGSDMLDIACGTGKHLAYFKRWYSCIGVDVNEGMLRVARKKIKGVVFKKGDMTTLKLNRTFDVITCLFSSIGYVRTYANLGKTIIALSKHLKPGGVLIIEPWFTQKTYRPGLPHMTTYSSPDIKIARLNVSERRGSVSVMDMHYLVAERGHKVKYFVDRHELGMFEPDRLIGLMRKANLETRLAKSKLMKDRGLYVGVKV